MSVVQYDQVKIVIKQMANFQPILHVHYYYQGKLVQTKFTVEKVKTKENQAEKFAIRFGLRKYKKCWNSTSR